VPSVKIQIKNIPWLICSRVLLKMTSRIAARTTLDLTSEPQPEKMRLPSNWYTSLLITTVNVVC